MSRPVPIRAVLSADQATLRGIVEELGRLSARVVFLRAVLQHSGEQELTVGWLHRLGCSIHEAVEDGRAAARSWQDGR